MSTSEITQKVNLGYADYILFPDDRNRHEIIDGAHHVSPPPNTYHQEVSIRLAYLLYSKITLAGLGKVYTAPVAVQLSEHDIFEPDLAVVLNDSRAHITLPKIVGSPDLLIEILSPSNRNYDLDDKREAYQRNEVPEYWIVDPLKHEVQQLVLDNQKYRPQPVERGTIRFAALPEISILLKEIW